MRPHNPAPEAPEHGWISHGWVVPAALATIVLVFAVGNYGLGFNQWKVHWWADVSWTVASLLTGMKCLSVARQMKGPLRRAWTLFGAGCLAWFSGMLAWDYLELVQNRITPFPALSDIGFLALAPFFVAGMFYYRSGTPALGITLKLVCNLGIIFSAILMGSLILLYQPIRTADVSFLYAITAMSYPVVYAASFLFGLTLLWLYVWGRDRKVLLLIIIGLGIHTFTDTLYAYSLLGKTYEAGHYLDVYWLVGFGFFYWAASVQGQADEKPSAKERGSDRIREMEMMIPTAAMASLLVVAYVFRENIQGPLLLLLFLAGLFFVGFLAAREWWSYRIQSRLFDEMAQSEEGLFRSLRELEKSEGRFSGILSMAKEAIISIDDTQRIIIFNKGAEDIFGYSQQEVLGQKIDILLPEAYRSKHDEHIRKFTRSGKARRGMGDEMEILGRRKNGEEFPAEASISMLDSGDEKVLTVVLRDVTERVRSQKALAEQAVRDPLTGLYNRRYFNYRIEEELARARRDEHSTAILLCDLDHFKTINDSHGHLVGDEVLRSLAKGLQEAIRGADLVFRWGGDEFVVLLSDTTREGVMMTADRIRKSVERLNHEAFLKLDVSIGAALFPEHCSDADGLIRLADRALYIAKKGGQKVHVGEEEYSLEDETVRVVFQPIMDMRSGLVFGYEALCRDSGNKLEIMQLFEKYNAIGQLGELKKLCLRLQLDHAREAQIRRAFINVDFKLLGEVEIPPIPLGTEIVLEISEAEAVVDVEHHLEVVSKWRKKGFKFAIDDFGAGFISLPFIAQMKPDYVKLDRSTMLQAVAGKEFRGFLKNWLEPLRNYSAGGIIAEGIESAQELGVVQDMGIHLVQGFLLGKPEEMEVSMEP